MKRAFTFWQRFDILFSTVFYKEKHLLKRNINFIRRSVHKFIKKRREFLLNKPNDQNINSVLIDTFLQATINGQSLSDKEIFDEAITFIFVVRQKKKKNSFCMFC